MTTTTTPRSTNANGGDKTLTPERLKTFLECQRAIRQSYANISEQLAIIRDQRLYETGYESFKEYYTDRWLLTPHICPHCGSHNLVDKYDELYEQGQTARGCADPIFYCEDCKRYLS